MGESTAGRLTDKMILPDTPTTTTEEDQQVVLEKINCLILLMSLIFLLLCLLLSVCFILLVYFLVQKKKTCSSNCSCRSVASETQISKKSPSANYVWTVEQDPIYEDILDLKNQSNTTVTNGGAALP